MGPPYRWKQEPGRILAVLLLLVSGRSGTAHEHSPANPFFPRRKLGVWLERFGLVKKRGVRNSDPLQLDKSLRYSPDDPIFGDIKKAKEKEEEDSPEQEGDVYAGMVDKSSPWSTVTDAIPALFQDPKRLGRFAARGCQIALIGYLAKSIWQEVRELMAIFVQATEGSEDNSSFVASRSEVQDVVAFFEQEREMTRKINAILEGDGDDSSKHKQLEALTIPPTNVRRLVKKLLASGLPLRSSEEDEQHNFPSVESLLLDLTPSEAKFLQKCLWTHPDLEHNEVLWDSVAGLEPVKERLMGTLASVQRRRGGTTASLSHQQSHAAYASLFANTPIASSSQSSDGDHRQSPTAHVTGVLLYGPPGCGKTLLVKSMASQAKLPCLVIAPSSLLSKYVGDTNQQVRTLFSLAAKLAPCIVCVDELDALFRERSDDEHEVSRDLKTEFLQHLDGMMSRDQRHRHPILVVGATNRPFDVDSAILRRLPQSHFVGMPDESSRLLLLTKLLQSVPTEPDLDLHQIALRTEGYSPSDIRQVLQTAALSGPMKRQHNGSNTESKSPAALSTDDILNALQVIPPTPLSARYRTQLSNFVNQPSKSMLSSSSSSQPFSSVSVDENGLSKWETLHGNFYNVGTLEIDNESFDTLRQFLSQLESSDDDSDYEMGDGDDDDY